MSLFWSQWKPQFWTKGSHTRYLNAARLSMECSNALESAKWYESKTLGLVSYPPCVVQRIVKVSSFCGRGLRILSFLFRCSRLGSRHYSLAKKEMGHHLAALPNGCGGQGDQLPKLNFVGLCNDTL